jgi:hypothetical protein
MEGQIQLSVILEVDYRRFLEREYRGTRRGGKLSRADREAIEQKILMARLPARPSSPPPVEVQHKEPASSSEVSVSSSQQSTDSHDGVDLAASAANLE